MIASLGMYDPPPLQAANDRFWALIRDALRDRGVAAPDALTRGEAAYWPAWQSADLVFSQTCGYPYRARLHDRVTLVGTPDYGVEGCPAGHYRSVFVVREDDPRGALADFDKARLAYNESLSQSGWAAPMAEAARRGIRFRAGRQTGAHIASACVVAAGEADVAALDAVTWDMLREQNLAPLNLRVLDHTSPTPALPYIAAADANADAAFAAVRDAIAGLSHDDRAALHLRGIVRIAAADYLAVPTPPPPAQFA